ncbi:hypothetical protein [Saccharopolyspora sp. NPDC050642]|uniref:hypothetical protein n=1 Tax=Saccharopolyspora sp. NPDC050642 TaxID=3157099 RepID=UPI0033CE6878
MDTRTGRNDAQRRDACPVTAHWPRFYRYQVAEPGVRFKTNRYPGAWIGVAVVIGRYAYCIKWADAR